MGTKSDKLRASDDEHDDQSLTHEVKIAPEGRRQVVAQVRQHLADSRTLRAFSGWAIFEGPDASPDNLIKDRRVCGEGGVSDRSRNPYDQDSSRRKRKSDKSKS